MEWRAIAYNQATESENRIHADEVARRYGFRGGLVPGVTVYAYLVHPAVAAWGLEWLSHGAATVVLRKPLYDGDTFCVRSTADGDGARGYSAEVLDSSQVVCADGKVWLPAVVPDAPVRRGDPPAPKGRDRPEATREVLEQLRERGMGALSLEWHAKGELDRYVRDLDEVPSVIRPDGDGYANPALSLGLANFVLASNVRLGPWIHVESEVQNFAAIPRGSRVVVEAVVTDLFERRGHEFVELDVAVFVEPDRAALRTQHRAIYRLREAAETRKP